MAFNECVGFVTEGLEVSLHLVYFCLETGRHHLRLVGIWFDDIWRGHGLQVGLFLPGLHCTIAETLLWASVCIDVDFFLQFATEIEGFSFGVLVLAADLRI